MLDAGNQISDIRNQNKGAIDLLHYSRRLNNFKL